MEWSTVKIEDDDGVDLVDLVEFYVRQLVVAVDDETGVFGYLIIEAAGGFVGFVGLPVNAGGTGVLGLLVDAVNQRFANAFTAG